MVMPKQLLEGLRRVNDQPQSSLAPGDRWPRDGRQTRHWPQSQVRSRLHRKGEGKTLGRPKIAADVETAIKATLAGGTGMIKAAKMHGVGVGTVQRVARGMCRKAQNFVTKQPTELEKQRQGQPFWLRWGGFNIFEHACLWHIAEISARQLASSLSRQRLSAALMGAP